jgi:hypothetical protein
MHLQINKGADRCKVAKDSWSYTPTLSSHMHAYLHVLQQQHLHKSRC